MPKLRLLAHAKVNLTLEVFARRYDGFHEIRSLMVPIALADRIVLRPEGRGLKLTVTGAPELERTDNLALRAARAFQDTFGLRGGLSIQLDKRVPIAAGLGGGSSDAGAVLRGLATLNGVQLDRLMPIAEALGSDVPFFVRERPAWATGRGEQLAPAFRLPGLHLLLVKPTFGIAAADAYRAWRAPTLTHRSADVTSRPGRRSGWNAVRTASQVGKLLVNDLQAGCLGLRPELGPLLTRLNRSGAAGVLMSGSGSTCFAVFSSAPALERGRRLFRPQAGETVLATRTLPGPTRAGRGSWVT